MLPVLLRWVRRSGLVLSPQSDLLRRPRPGNEIYGRWLHSQLSAYGIKLKIKQIAMFIVQFFRTLIRKWVYIWNSLLSSIVYCDIWNNWNYGKNFCWTLHDFHHKICKSEMIHTPKNVGQEAQTQTAVVRLLNKDNAAPCYISSYGIMQPARPPGTFCCYSCHEAATHPAEGIMMKYISWWGHNIFSRKINTENWNWLILRKNNICVKLQ